MVITSAVGRGSAKKSPEPVVTPILHSGLLDRAGGNGLYHGQVKAGAAKMRVVFGEGDRQLAGGTADIADGPVAGKVELLGQGTEVAVGDS